jgi:hypothetical protein
VAGALPIEHYLGIVSNSGFKNLDIRKKKRIDIPDALLNEFLSPEQIDIYHDSRVGIYSITLTGEKPACQCGCK